MRVKGHTLRGEGAAFETVPGGDWAVRTRWDSVSGKGFGVCSCGARSPIYDSSNLRKAWHRNHKAEVSS